MAITNDPTLRPKPLSLPDTKSATATAPANAAAPSAAASTEVAPTQGWQAGNAPRAAPVVSAPPKTVASTQELVSFSPTHVSKAQVTYSGADPVHVRLQVAERPTNGPTEDVGAKRRDVKFLDLQGNVQKGPDGTLTWSYKDPVRGQQNRALVPNGNGGFDIEFRSAETVSLRPKDWGAPISRADAQAYYQPKGTVLSGGYKEVPLKKPEGIGGKLNSAITGLLIGNRDKFTQNKGVLNVSENGVTRELKFTYYKPKGEGPHPMVMVEPILSGDYEFEAIQAQNLAANGIGTVIVERPGFWFQKGNTEKDLEHLLHQAVIDQRTVLDWFRTQPDVDTKRMGASGFCAGGMAASILGGVDEALVATYQSIPSGDVPHVLAFSQLGGVGGFRADRLAARGVPADEIAVWNKFLATRGSTGEENLDVLQRQDFSTFGKGNEAALLKSVLPKIAKWVEESREIIKTDAVRLAHLQDPKELKLAFPGNDVDVPWVDQAKYILESGATEATVYPDVGHFGLAVHYPSIASATVDHFKKKFAAVQ